jgi:predicted N-acetyltransferase YhbS
MTQALTLRTADGFRDEDVRALLETSFGRVDAEARLLEELGRNDPASDSGLALVAESEGAAVGFALFSPREFLIRGQRLPLAIAAPLAVMPAERRSGVARFLLMTGRAALTDRGILGAVTLGAPELFSQFGYGSAFDMHLVRVPTEYLPTDGNTDSWRALNSADLDRLCQLQEESYGCISGTELRRPCALDWEGCAEGSFTLVHGAAGEPNAYLRFRRRNELEITECGAQDPAGVGAILALMSRLAREHASTRVIVNLAPPHPVALALYHRGAMIERCNFGGAALLAIFDWSALFEALRGWWAPVLECHGARGIDLLIEGQSHILGETDGKTPQLWIPAGWGPSLICGQRSAHDLLFEPAVVKQSRLEGCGTELVQALFTRCDSLWTWGPAFELVDG